MPFEFTGEPTPRLGAPSSFSCFAVKSTADCTWNTQIPAFRFKGTLAPSLTFRSTRPRLSRQQQPVIRGDFGAVPRPSAKNPLEKALVRALRDRPAIWGRSDIAGDEVIQDVLEGDETFDVRTVLSGLRQVEQTHPDVVRFTPALFDYFQRPSGPACASSPRRLCTFDFILKGQRLKPCQIPQI